MVPTDLSDFSLIAMEYARTFAGLFKAHIYVIHVVKHIPLIPSRNATRQSWTVRRNTQLTKELEQFFGKKLKPRHDLIHIVRRGDPDKEIIKYAQDENIDLIIMATHGGARLSHILIGRVAENIVRNSPVPVLTIRPPRCAGRSSK